MPQRGLVGGAGAVRQGGFRGAHPDREAVGTEPGVEPSRHSAPDVLHGPFHEQVGRRAHRDQDGQEQRVDQDLDPERMMRRPGQVTVDLDERRVEQVDRVADQPQPGQDSRPQRVDWSFGCHRHKPRSSSSGSLSAPASAHTVTTEQRHARACPSWLPRSVLNMGLLNLFFPTSHSSPSRHLAGPPVIGNAPAIAATITAFYAPLAQLAEQRTLNPRVRGSSPWRRTRTDLALCPFRWAAGRSFSRVL